MSNENRFSLAAVLASAGVGAVLGAGLVHAIAGRSTPTASEPSAAPAQSAEEAGRAIAEVLRAPASTESAAELAQLLTRLGPEAVGAIAPIILDPSETLDAPRAMLLTQFWADRDPLGAAKWATTLAPAAYRPSMLDVAVGKLAETDPQQAGPFVGGISGPNTNLIKPFVHGWVLSEKPGVEDWVLNLGYGFKRQKALGALMRARIAKDGAPAAIAWWESLPESEDNFKLEAFHRLTTELAYADPDAGVAWYERHREGPYADGLMARVARAWVAVDGPAVMRWLSEQPAGPERDGAVVDTTRSWGSADLAAVRRWMPSADRIEDWFQPGLPLFARQIAFDEPLEGIRFAERITDEERRRTTIVQIARQWRMRDAAAAEAWIAQSPLSEEDRERVVQVTAPRNTPRREIEPEPDPAS